MNRRDFLQLSSAGLAGLANWAIGLRRDIFAVQKSQGAKNLALKAPPKSPFQKLFPTDLPDSEWKQFPAAGYSRPVSGVLFSTGKPPCCGVPLGGISTGCVDIESNGTLGFNCLFDAFPRKPQLLKPFLGLAVGNRTWVLTSEPIRAGGVFETCHEPRRSREGWMVTVPLLKGVQSAKEIHYWGHFPVADLEYEIPGSSVDVALRAWAPFIPGDVIASNTPGAVFEVRLRNTSASPQQGTLAFSFPGPTQQEAQVPADVPPKDMEIGGMKASRPVVEGGVEGRHQRIQAPVNGVSVEIETGVGYCLGVVGEQRVRTGGGMRTIPLIPGGSAERGEDC